MKTFTIEGKDDSPHIYIDSTKEMIDIRGNSTLKDTNHFYSSLLKWIIAFNTGPYRTNTINLNLKKINDSSLKWIIVIFRKLTVLLSDKELIVNLYLIKNNHRILTIGQSLKNQPGYNVNIISFK